MTASFDQYLDAAQRQILAGLDSPERIQAFLDETPYSTEDADRCPVSVLRDRLAHCLDGGLFAAAALRCLGYPPLIVDLIPEPGTDDDHILAIYKVDGLLGAVAKSNFTGLRFREAVYRTVRELVMSYFESYFNVRGEKTLRAYTVPLNLQDLDSTGWMWRDEGVEPVVHRLDRLRQFRVISPAMAVRLSPVDKLSYAAGTVGTNPAGLYKPLQSRQL